MPYSVQPGNQIFVKSYGFLSFTKTMSENMVKLSEKNVISK